MTAKRASAKRVKVGKARHEAAAPKHATPSVKAAATVLVVDDHAENCDVYCEYLTYVGYDVIDAASGAAAILRAQKDRPDVIVMDLVMPGMDGIQATRLLKADRVTRSIPVVVVTSAGPEFEAQAKEAGTHAYLTKPCRLQDLEAVLRKVISRAKP